MTILYSPTGAKVDVTDPARVTQLEARGWTLTPPTLPDPPSPPWGDGLELPIDATGPGATWKFGEFIVQENSLNEDFSTYPDREVWRFKRFGDTDPDGGNLISVKNEFGETRLYPAKPSTTPFRIYAKEHASDTNHDNNVALLEILSDRDNRTLIFAVYPDGRIVAPGYTVVYAGTVNPGAGVAWLNTA